MERKMIDLEQMLKGTNLYSPVGVTEFSVSWKIPVRNRGQKAWIKDHIKNNVQEQINSCSGAKIINIDTDFNIESFCMGTQRTEYFVVSLVLGVPGFVNILDNSVSLDSEEKKYNTKLVKEMMGVLKKRMAEIVLSYFPSTDIKIPYQANVEDEFFICQEYGYKNGFFAINYFKESKMLKLFNAIDKKAIESICKNSEACLKYLAIRKNQNINRLIAGPLNTPLLFLIKLTWNNDVDDKTRKDLARKIENYISNGCRVLPCGCRSLMI